MSTSGSAVGGRLAGKVAIVTGAARGMGAAIAQRFIEEGAIVALTDVLPEVQATAAALGPRATAYLHDVADEARWREIEAELTAKHGGIDVLVNNAGVLMFKDLLSTSAADLRKLLEVNVVGTFLGMQVVGAGMVARKRGSIVNNSSARLLGPASGVMATFRLLASAPCWEQAGKALVPVALDSARSPRGRRRVRWVGQAKPRT